MANPIYNMFRGNRTNEQRNQYNADQEVNLNNLISEFNKFKSSFKGDPNEVINSLLAQGKISKEQLDRVTKLAYTLKGLM